MAHPECPGRAAIARADVTFDTPPRTHHQRGRGKNHLYHVQAIRQSRDVIALWWTDKLHPHTEAPSFRPDAPNALVSATHAPDQTIWHTTRHNKHLATIIAAAIARMEASEWPS